MKEGSVYIEDYSRVEFKKVDSLAATLPFEDATLFKIALFLEKISDHLTSKKLVLKSVFELEKEGELGKIEAGDILIVSDREKYYPLRFSNLSYAKVLGKTNTSCLFKEYPIARVENSTGKLALSTLMHHKWLRRRNYTGQIAIHERSIAAVWKQGSEEFIQFTV